METAISVSSSSQFSYVKHIRKMCVYVVKNILYLMNRIYFLRLNSHIKSKVFCYQHFMQSKHCESIRSVFQQVNDMHELVDFYTRYSVVDPTLKYVTNFFNSREAFLNNNCSLYSALLDNNTAVCTFLINEGIDLSKTFTMYSRTNEISGMNPLHIAAKNGNIELCRLLISKDVQSSLDSDDKQPIDYARINNHQDIVSIFEPLTLIREEKFRCFKDLYLQYILPFITGYEYLMLTLVDKSFHNYSCTYTEPLYQLIWKDMSNIHEYWSTIRAHWKIRNNTLSYDRFIKSDLASRHMNVILRQKSVERILRAVPMQKSNIRSEQYMGRYISSKVKSLIQNGILTNDDTTNNHLISSNTSHNVQFSIELGRYIARYTNKEISNRYDEKEIYKILSGIINHVKLKFETNDISKCVTSVYTVIMQFEKDTRLVKFVIKTTNDDQLNDIMCKVIDLSANQVDMTTSLSMKHNAPQQNNEDRSFEERLQGLVTTNVLKLHKYTNYIKCMCDSENDNMNGLGSFFSTTIDGRICQYSGSFKNGSIDGKGILTLFSKIFRHQNHIRHKNWIHYNGSFSSNNIMGEGVMTCYVDSTLRHKLSSNSFTVGKLNSFEYERYNNNNEKNYSITCNNQNKFVFKQYINNHIRCLYEVTCKTDWLQKHSYDTNCVYCVQEFECREYQFNGSIKQSSNVLINNDHIRTVSECLHAVSRYFKQTRESLDNTRDTLMEAISDHEKSLSVFNRYLMHSNTSSDF